MKVFIVSALALLPGCAALMPQVPREVRVPIAVPCLVDSDVPKRPELSPDADLLSANDKAFVLAVVRDRESLIDYTKKLEAAIEQCK